LLRARSPKEERWLQRPDSAHQKPAAIQHPRKRAAQPRRPWWQDRPIVIGLVVLAVLVAVILLKSGAE